LSEHLVHGYTRNEVHGYTRNERHINLERAPGSRFQVQVFRGLDSACKPIEPFREREKEREREREREKGERVHLFTSSLADGIGQ
jgi:hypothetical protein